MTAAPHQPIPMPFQGNPAIYTGVTPTTVELVFIEAIDRNEKQRQLLANLSLHLGPLARDLYTDPILHQCGLYEVKLPDMAVEDFTSINNEPVFQSRLYLFNVIVALEWDPSPTILQQIRLSASKASDFLYDVTNGYMAIGQVVIGGPDLMEAADIQVMSSNRFHPRSWIDALNQPSKFLPIRIGRGIWQKNQDSLATWDSPEGFRALVHEWGHYAYGLVDEYLIAACVKAHGATPRVWGGVAKGTPNSTKIAAPNVALPLESLMANTTISEFAPVTKIFTQIHTRYGAVPANQVLLDGPAELPLLLPLFPDLLETNQNNENTALRLKLGWSTNYQQIFEPLLLNFTNMPPPFTPTSDRPQSALPITPASSLPQGALPIKLSPGASHWVYLLKGPRSQQGLPDYVIAQGKIGQRDLAQGDLAQGEYTQGFPILGSMPDDEVLIVSQVGEGVLVHRATIQASRGKLALGSWVDVTPTNLRQLAPDQPFFVDVIPGLMQEQPRSVTSPVHARVKVGVVTNGQNPTTVRLYPCGQHKAGHGGIDIAWNPDTGTSQPQDVYHPDGLVFMRWIGAGIPTEELFVCGYSQGGGPGTSGGGRLPITGGSAEGNAMLFFVDNAVRDLVTTDGATENVAPGDTTDDKGVRIITTTLTIGSQSVTIDDRQTRASSYTFSVASNKSLEPYPATLVLNYDDQALQRGGDLLVYRWYAGAWQRCITYAPDELSYVAIPIIDGPLSTSLSDNSAELHIEHFRIFWTPT